MSFYIKIDNPDRGREVTCLASGTPVEGPGKVCLVTAFTSVVGSSDPHFPPDQSMAGKDIPFVAVSLADQSTVILPFGADDFGELLVDAEARHQIADFTHDHWPDRGEDLAALRGPVLS